MKQLLQSTRTGAIEIADVPAPTIRPGGVLIRTEASALSVGTERMLAEFARKSMMQKALNRPDLVRQVLQKARREGWKSTWDAVQTKLDSSLPVGYSSAGTVLAVGDGSSPFRVGDRVACGGGGYATHSEIAFVPYNLCARIPDGVAAEAAAFATIGAVGLHGLRLGRVEFGGSVAVIGLGIIGQIVVQAARAAGLRVVAIDRDAARVALATAHGAEVGAVLGKDDPAQVVARLTGDTGVDAAIITAASESNDPLVLGAQCCRDRGRVVAVGAIGLNVPRKAFFEKELELVVSRSYGPGRYDPVYEEHGVDYPLSYVRWTEQRNLETFVQLAASGGIDMAPLITHRFPIADAASAYNLITGEQKEPFLGVTLSYPAAPKADKAVTVRTPAVVRSGSAAVGVAVIGAGNYARAVLLPRLAKMPHVRLVAVTSAGGVSALDAARQFGFERAATGHEDVIADPAVQCVIVETRHNLHAEIAEQALKAGKATFVEKPLALTEEQLQRVAAAWVAGGRPAATVGFNRRSAPMIGALREFQSGRRGPWIITLRVNAGFIPDTSWVVDPDVGGGRLLGEGCHFIDLAQYLAGAQPVEVFCSGPSPDLAVRQGESITTIRFEDGSVASVAYATGGSKLYGKERVEVLGGGGVATIDDYRMLDLADANRRRVTKDRWSQNKGHEAYLDGFLKSVAEGRPFGVDFRDLLVTSLATIRAVDSVRSGQPAVVDGAGFLRAAGVD